MNPGFGSSLIYFIVLIALLYFLFIRPQQKRSKEHQELIENIKIDDEVVTLGGLVGKVVKIGEDQVDLEVSDGVVVKVVKNSISRVMEKGSK